MRKRVVAMLLFGIVFIAGCGQAISSFNRIGRVSTPLTSFSISFQCGTTTLASGENSGNGSSDVHHVELWNSERQVPFNVVINTTYLVNQVCYNPDGSRLAVATNDTTAKVYDTGNYSVVGKTNRHSYPVKAVSYSPNGTTLISGDGGGVVEIQGSNSDLTVRAQNTSISALAFLNSTTFAASAGNSSIVKFWTTSGVAGSQVTGPRLGVYSLAVSADQTKLAVGGQDDAGGQVIMFSLSMDNNGSIQGTSVWNRLLGGKWASGLAFAPSGDQIAIAPYDDSRSVAVVLLDVASGAQTGTAQSFAGAIQTVAYRKDGVKLAAGGNDKNLNGQTQVKFQNTGATKKP